MQTTRRSFFQQIVQPSTQPTITIQSKTKTTKLKNVDPLQHLLKRATWGITPKMLAHAQAIGREAWLDEQLNPESIDDVIYENKMRLQPVWQMERREIYNTFGNDDYADNAFFRNGLELGCDLTFRTYVTILRTR